MKFSKEETIELIELYRKRDLLWNPKSPGRYNKIRKEDAWREIAQEMQRSVDQCKKKMEYLLTALRREKMKMRKSTGTGKGAEEVYRSSWFAFEAMRFIWDKNNPRRTLNAIEVSNEQMDRPAEVLNQEMNSSLATLQNKNPDLGSGNAQSSQQLRPPKKLKTQVDERLDKTFEILTASAHQLNDESHHFGNLVASKLRSYDVNVRHAIQSDIMNIFMRANRGYYNNINNYPNYVLQGPSTAHPGYPPTYSHSPEFYTSHSSQTSITSTSGTQTPLPSPNNSPVCDDFTVQDHV